MLTLVVDTIEIIEPILRLSDDLVPDIESRPEHEGKHGRVIRDDLEIDDDVISLPFEADRCEDKVLDRIGDPSGIQCEDFVECILLVDDVDPLLRQEMDFSLRVFPPQIRDDRRKEYNASQSPELYEKDLMRGRIAQVLYFPLLPEYSLDDRFQKTDRDSDLSVQIP